MHQVFRPMEARVAGVCPAHLTPLANRTQHWPSIGLPTAALPMPNIAGRLGGTRPTPSPAPQMLEVPWEERIKTLPRYKPIPGYDPGQRRVPLLPLTPQ